MSDPQKETKRWQNLFGLAQRPKPQVGVTPADVVHRDNKARLLRYRPRPAGLAPGAPILLVPSLINRHYVLDLMPGKSFVEYLVGLGHDVYCIDWGTPGDEDRYVTFDEIVDGMIGRALAAVCKASGAERAHVLGYCMGGLMVAIHAAVRPARVASVCAVAAPVRFADDGLLSAWARTPTLDLRVLVDSLGNVPWQLLQSSFQLLRPTLPLSKAVHLLDRAWDDEYLDGFLALETWGNDAVGFPGEAYARYIQELYREDRLIQGTFALSGRPAHLGAIRVPTAAVTFEHDNIVPAESARVLLDLVGAPAEERVSIHVNGGHVGAMVSRAASRGVWPKIAAFFGAADARWQAQTSPAVPSTVAERPRKHRR
ncbi:MAG: alpha/beta fold hydrolase [Myxococcales bacterium]|nr:alpha/beta fold hydrolase [Myxococcales bacterium]